MDSETAEAYVDAAAAALEIPLLAEHRPGVLTYFRLAAAMADLVSGLALQLDDEPAAVFRPIETGEVAGGERKRNR